MNEYITDPEFFAAISSEMLHCDPINLDYGFNPDEYYPEAAAVIPRLSSCSSSEDVLLVLHEEFCHFFGKDMAGPESAYTELANKIWMIITDTVASKTSAGME